MPLEDLPPDSLLIRTRRRRQKSELLAPTIVPENLSEVMPLDRSKTLTLSTEEAENALHSDSFFGDEETAEESTETETAPETELDARIVRPRRFRGGVPATRRENPERETETPLEEKSLPRGRYPLLLTEAAPGLEAAPRWHHWFEIFPSKLRSRQSAARPDPVLIDDLHIWHPPHSAPHNPYASPDTAGFHSGRPPVRASLASAKDSGEDPSPRCYASDSLIALLAALTAVVVALSIIVCTLLAMVFAGRRRRRRASFVAKRTGPCPPSACPHTQCPMSPPGMAVCLRPVMSRRETSRVTQKHRSLEARLNRRRGTRQPGEGGGAGIADRDNRAAEVTGERDASHSTRCHSLPCACLSKLATPLVPQASAPEPAETASPCAVVEIVKAETPPSVIRCVGEELDLLRPPLKQEVVHRWETSYVSDRKDAASYLQESALSVASKQRLCRDVSSAGEFKTPRETPSEAEHSSSSLAASRPSRPLVAQASPCLSTGDGKLLSSDSGDAARCQSREMETPGTRGRPPLPVGKRRVGRALEDVRAELRADVAVSQLPSPSRIWQRRGEGRRRAMTDETPLRQDGVSPKIKGANSDLARLLRALQASTRRGRQRRRLPRSLDRLHPRARRRRRQSSPGVPLAAGRPQGTPGGISSGSRASPRCMGDATPRPISGADRGLCCVLGDRIYRLRRASSLERDYLHCDSDFSSSSSSSFYHTGAPDLEAENILYSSTLGDSDSLLYGGGCPLSTGPETSSSLDDDVDLPPPSCRRRWTPRHPCLMRVTHFDAHTPRPNRS
eukprot:Gregarina_sp_Poly_1__1272@NODE_130_length_13255_cov_150_516454_g116_i0_p3_GENE_NODE_130_length_13255_cov_150_516454_g116_i0NODE_130_length_13255_cov_150_516454_g116_i0_p3_ORF_typecomplete_len790_score151_70DAG1/PF05454_11/0_024Herpes_gE/PF02480_16/0_033_NODE_130_length_13255_cov_150_516454_g116_i0917011539